jgi:tetratricopeptide (TPR) repeat protein
MRQNKALKKEADRLRVQAEKLEPSTINTETSEKDPIVENYNLALHFWSEYIYRTEGLKRSARQLRETQGKLRDPLDELRGVGNNTPLKETGIGSNTPPSDPYLPEILLRQAWIYRQMGLPKRAISTYYDVLTGATKQKINNLTRFSRIALVARSQIANSYWETAKNREDINEAIDLYTRLLPSDEEAFGVGQELDKMEELNYSQLQLKLLRALFKSDEYARTEIRRKERKLEELKRSMVKQAQDSASTYLSRNLLEKEGKKIQGEIAAIEQDRTKNWTLLKKNAEQFIESYNETEPNLRYDGEIRYFQIVANEALGNALHVQRDMQVLLDNESIPPEFQQAWLATRVRVMIDVSNLLFSEAVKAEESASALSSKKATIVLQGELQPKEAKGKEQSGSRHARPQNLEMAINGYKQALLYDQTYRSQIMLRQQIAWCQDRLGQIEKASETYKTIGHLCEMHAKDLNSTLKVVQFMAKLKFDNLTQEETHDKDSQEKSSDS